MNVKQKGFTLIELIVVIVILGILAATALPKFIDMSSDAKTAAIQGAAGSLTASSSINYSASLVRGATGAGVVRLSAAAAGASMRTGGGIGGADSAKFAIATDVSCLGTTAGVSGTVALSHTEGVASVNSAVATIICTG